MSVIRVKNLGKAYKQYTNRWSRLAEWITPFTKSRHTLKWILRDINFEVGLGEVVGIVGINGAGKSTLLKLITGTSEPTTGSVEITGKVSAILELGIGFHPDFTGRQNVMISGQLMGMSEQEITALMPEIEDFAELVDYMDEPVRVYSTGMSIRLAFAVATAKRPDILIVDEALSVGDAYFQHKSFRRIRRFQEQGTTILFVSHDIAAVRGICHRCVWLDKGVVRLQGDTKTVLDAYGASTYEKQQQVAQAATDLVAKSPIKKDAVIWRRDARQDFINASNLRNDIQIVNFDWGAERWGDGHALIHSVEIVSPDGSPLSWIVGGEEVILKVEFQALKDLERVTVGFQVCDRLGQILFGDNTFLTYLDNPRVAKAQELLSCKFRFLMPLLPQGAYSVTAAVAVGTQENHVINDWVSQTLTLESTNHSGVNGMIGIPMSEINLETMC